MTTPFVKPADRDRTRTQAPAAGPGAWRAGARAPR